MNEQGTSPLFALGVPADAYTLPHPRVALPILLVVRRAICVAFDTLRKRGFALATEEEDDVTNALHAVLENELRQRGTVPGFNRHAFEEVKRHCPTSSYNFVKTKTAPDLCFKLRDDGEPRPVISAHEALFVECKPVGKKHFAGSDYCDAGLARFVEGDYAWAMQDAIMVAYVRHGRSLEENLLPAMKERSLLKTVSMPRSVPGAPAEPRAEALRVSRHNRGFAWPHNKGCAVDIFIYHSWHCCDD